MSIGPQITSVAFITASAAERRAGLLGWVTCIVDGSLVIDGITVRRTQSGRRTLSFPSRRDAQGRQHPYVRPIDDAARQHLEREIFKALRLDLGEKAP